MARDRLNPDFLFTAVHVRCDAGHQVGTVIKNLGVHPRAGTYARSAGVTFEDVPEPTDLSGRIRGQCHECRPSEKGTPVDVVIRWERVKAKLDENETAGLNSSNISA